VRRQRTRRSRPGRDILRTPAAGRSSSRSGISSSDRGTSTRCCRRSNGRLTRSSARDRDVNSFANGTRGRTMRRRTALLRWPTLRRRRRSRTRSRWPRSGWVSDHERDDRTTPDAAAGDAWKTSGPKGQRERNEDGREGWDRRQVASRLTTHPGVTRKWRSAHDRDAQRHALRSRPGSPFPKRRPDGDSTTLHTTDVPDSGALFAQARRVLQPGGLHVRRFGHAVFKCGLLTGGRNGRRLHPGLSGAALGTCCDFPWRRGGACRQGRYRATA
jgi:hypothetical protein